MTEADNHGEKCARCGEVDEDRRTLWMACFYAMEELREIPFERHFLFHADDPDKLVKTKDPTSITVGNGQTITLGAGTVRTDGDLTPHGFYTLRVCKDCRASWMEAIQAWFKASPAKDDGKREVGSGIFVRRNGTSVEVTEEEWRRLRAEKNAEKP